MTGPHLVSEDEQQTDICKVSAQLGVFTARVFVQTTSARAARESGCAAGVTQALVHTAFEEDAAWHMALREGRQRREC